MADMEQIYKENFNAIYKYLFCLTHNKDISEELTQETFTKAVSHISRYNGKCKLSVWLCQIAKHLWYDYYRKNKRMSSIDISDLNEFQDIFEIEEYIIDKEEKSELYNRFKILDSNTRKVMNLKLIGELTFKEIGIIMNKNENWARVTFYRGKNKLKGVD